MTQAAGRRRATKHSQPPSTAKVLQAVLCLVGAVLAGWAWFYLVGAAIEFGTAARSGGGIGWAFCIAATIGAVVCLVLILVLVTRVLTTLGVLNKHRPRRVAARRRAR